MIEITREENKLDETMSLATLGLDRHKKPELFIESVPIFNGKPLQILVNLIESVANDVKSHDLSDGAIVSIGNYGHIRLEVEVRGDEQPRLYAKDVDAGSKNANGFIGRFLVLAGLEQMELGTLSDALELFDAGILLQPNDAILLHARASVTHDLLVSGEISGERADELSLGVFADLLLSIELSPDRPEAYLDLISMLQSFRPVDQGLEEHQEWILRIVERALSYPSQNPDALDARKALEEFARNSTAE